MEVWRADGYECWGTAVAHEQRTNASLRETTQDVAATEKGDEKEPGRRKKGALNQNKQKRVELLRRRGDPRRQGNLRAEGKLR